MRNLELLSSPVLSSQYFNNGHGSERERDNQAPAGHRSATIHLAERPFKARLMGWRWVELVLIFVGLPLALKRRIIPLKPIPLLFLSGLIVCIVLRTDPTFDATHLWNPEALGAHFAPMMSRFAILGSAFSAAVLAVLKCLGRWDLPFILVRKKPRVWMVLMLLYPILSAYPQELIFRAYFFHRFEPLFGNGFAMIAVSAALFAFLHLPFGHWISMLLSLLGGLLFGFTYLESGSLILASIEHGLWGNLIFTIGLGDYFYHGADRLKLAR